MIRQVNSCKVLRMMPEVSVCKHLLLLFISKSLEFIRRMNIPGGVAWYPSELQSSNGL